jgi:hypothetical protein
MVQIQSETISLTIAIMGIIATGIISFQIEMVEATCSPITIPTETTFSPVTMAIIIFLTETIALQTITIMAIIMETIFLEITSTQMTSQPF